MKRTVKNTLADVLLLLIVWLSGSCVLVAQTSQSSDKVTGIDRWGFKVNALELVCTIPNVSAEFDLTSSPYNRLTLSLTAKYNPNTWHSLTPVTVFNMMEFRPECRWWFRRAQSSDKRFSSGAFYVGGFLHGGTFAVKFSPTGRQGVLLGAGASFGYDFPLHTFRKFSLDFELGASLGVGVSRYDCFKMNSSETDYAIIPDASSRWKVLPYPLLSELKACFVFRTLSIRDKYKKEDPQKVIRRQEKEAAREAAREKRGKKEVAE